MDVTPKTLREVKFETRKRGYAHEEVDEFLDQVASGIEVLQDRLRQAVERAQRAEAAASESSGSDETLKRTLVLAQRTADLAVQESREQAARILATAEQQAQALLSETEERARRTHDEALSSIRSELATLEASRQRAQAEIDAMHRWIDDHRTHLAAALKDALSAVERAGAVSPAPLSSPIDLPRGASVPQHATPAQQLAQQALPAEAPAPDDGPATAMWGPGQADFPDQPTGEVPAVQRATFDPEGAQRATDTLDPDEQALDEFFEDGDLEDDDRRFGGRLRRRR